MSFPDKEVRKRCWDARDKYWQCLDTNDGHTIQNKVNSEICKELRKFYEQSCPAQWVTHFDRKRTFLAFKERIEKEGYEPLDNK